MTTARITDSVITLTHGVGSFGDFNRDLLATAYLLRLDNPGGVADALVAEHGLEYAEAARYALAARICIEHNIEL